MNVDMSDLVSQRYLKGDVTLYASGCTVAPTTTSIFIHEGWSMENMKSLHLWHEVASDKFCVRTVSGPKPVTYYFNVYFCYFKLRMKYAHNWKCMYKMLFHQELFWPIVCILILRFYLLVFLPLWLFVWHADSIQ